MAKKGKVKQQAKDADNIATGGDTTPKFSDYFKAVILLVRDWVKQNKLKLLIGLMILVAGIFMLFILLKPSASELTHDQIVINVNKELGISGDSNPAILTVEDESKAVQPFLDQAENGDKVLLYYKAKKAVLFRPSEDRIVHHGAYTPPEAKVFLRKGTADDSKISEARAKLETIDDIEIISQDSSPRQNYSGITIVSVTDRYDEKVRELEELFGTKVVRIPEGESFPEADILIIIGS